jgi:tetratricopeptide (TPR) repeat protein
MNDYPPQPDMGNRALNEFLRSIISSTAQADIDLVAHMNQCATLSADNLERMELYEKLIVPLNTRWKAHRDELALIAYLAVATELLGLYLPGDPDRGTQLYDYARALESDFPCLEDDGLLNEAIRMGREALALRPTGHPDRALICALFANLLAKYVEGNEDEIEDSEDETDDSKDEAVESKDEAEGNEDEALLREVIQLDREVLSLRPIGHPNRDEALRDLAASLISLYHEIENVSLLEEVISLERDVLELQPFGHPRHAASCASLSASLEALHDETEDISLVHEMIPLDREVMSLLPADHDMRSNAYGHLASSLFLLYKNTNDEAVLDEVIQLERDALARRPEGHSGRESVCENLAQSLSTKFDSTGDPTLIGEAIHLQRELLALRPPDHPERASTCDATAFWLTNRFSQTGDTTLLDEALKLGREALALAPLDDPCRLAVCDTVARALAQLYEAQNSQDATLLQEAIRLRREILALQPAGHPDHAYNCLNLAGLLDRWFDKTNDPAAMSEPVQLERQAVASLDAHHPERGWACTNLANSLISTFKANDERRDEALLDEASMLLDEALLLHPLRHPLHWKTLWQRVRLAVARKNYIFAIELLDKAFDIPTFNIFEFLDFIIGALRSLDVSELSRSEEKALLRIYESAINFVIFATGFAVSHSAQLQRLLNGSSLGSYAFVISTRVDELPLGLQLLERARGIIWAETLHMRNPQLDRVPEALAKKPEALLPHNTAKEPQLQEEPAIDARYRPFLSERDILYEQRSQLQFTLQEIRSLPGLHNFMREPTSEMLQTIADRNVVVVLVENDGDCHALIIGSSRGPLVHIALEGIGEKGPQELTLTHSTWQQRGACDDSDVDAEDGQRLIMKRSQRLSAAKVVLAKLWRTVVKPIITHLGLVVRVLPSTSSKHALNAQVEETGSRSASNPLVPDRRLRVRPRSCGRHLRRLGPGVLFRLRRFVVHADSDGAATRTTRCRGAHTRP